MERRDALKRITEKANQKFMPRQERTSKENARIYQKMQQGKRRAYRPLRADIGAIYEENQDFMINPEKYGAESNKAFYDRCVEAYQDLPKDKNVLVDD